MPNQITGRPIVRKRELPESLTKEILKAKTYGQTHDQISAKYGVSRATIGNILKRELGESWRKLKES